jgi:hypothetical protein
MAGDIQLHRNAFGQLVFMDSEGREHVNVELARAFPISAPLDGISMLDQNGRELVWIPRLDDSSREIRRLLEEELQSREFMPEIKRIRGVSGYATPCTWQVETDRGDTEFVLKAEEDIRRLSTSALLIVDSRGIQFLIRDPRTLDKASRRILDRFM